MTSRCDIESVRRRRRRYGLLLLATLLLGGACSDGTSPDAGNGNGGGTPTSYDHARAPGASAHDLLAADAFEHLVVQIQYVDGFPPSAAGLHELDDFLSARLNKPGGITLMAPQSITVAAQAAYSASDIRSLEGTHRTEYTRGDTLATYLLFLDGEFAGGANVLGLAYNNTSMAVFQEKVVDNTGDIGQPPQTTVEAAVMHHEFGHIMGLVNTGSDMQTPHQDAPNGSHCDNEDCLMYYTVRTTDFLSNLLGGTVPDLDQNCLDDLQANGGK